MALEINRVKWSERVPRWGAKAVLFAVVGALGVSLGLALSWIVVRSGATPPESPSTAAAIQQGHAIPEDLNLPTAVPQFTATYEVSRGGNGDDSKSTIRLEYSGPRNWSYEVLDSSNPFARGRVVSVSGNVRTTQDATFAADPSLPGIENSMNLDPQRLPAPLPFFYNPQAAWSLSRGLSLSLSDAAEREGWTASFVDVDSPESKSWPQGLLVVSRDGSDAIEAAYDIASGALVRLDIRLDGQLVHSARLVGIEIK